MDLSDPIRPGPFVNMYTTVTTILLFRNPRRPLGINFRIKNISSYIFFEKDRNRAVFLLALFETFI